ncbi:hypothetical protein AQBE111736_01985 [Aquirufa beregesia]
MIYILVVRLPLGDANLYNQPKVSNFIPRRFVLNLECLFVATLNCGLHKNIFFIPLAHDYAFNYLLLRLLLRRIPILPIGYCRYRFNLNLL